MVTGGSRGIGYYAALGLARAGCRRIRLYARNPEGLKAAASRLSTETGANVDYEVLDLRNPDSVGAALTQAIDELGGLDVVALSYGNPSCEPCTLDEASAGDWVEAYNMYTVSTVEAIKAVARYNDRQTRFIVFTSFTVGEYHRFLVVADAARAALPLIVRAAAREYSSKIIPVLVVLGSFDTPGARRTISAIAERLGVDPGEFWRDEVEGRSPLRRVGRPDELAGLTAFLARAPEYMAGSVVYFEGASSACLRV